MENLSIHPNNMQPTGACYKFNFKFGMTVTPRLPVPHQNKSIIRTRPLPGLELTYLKTDFYFWELIISINICIDRYCGDILVSTTFRHVADNEEHILIFWV